MNVRICERVRDRLVRSDRAIKYDSLAGVVHRPLQCDFTDAARHGREQNSLGVQPMKDVLEAATAFADEAPTFNWKFVIGHLT